MKLSEFFNVGKFLFGIQSQPKVAPQNRADYERDRDLMLSNRSEQSRKNLHDNVNGKIDLLSNSVEAAGLSFSAYNTTNRISPKMGNEEWDVHVVKAVISDPLSRKIKTPIKLTISDNGGIIMEGELFSNAVLLKNFQEAEEKFLELDKNPTVDRVLWNRASGVLNSAKRELQDPKNVCRHAMGRNLEENITNVLKTLGIKAVEKINEFQGQQIKSGPTAMSPS